MDSNQKRAAQDDIRDLVFAMVYAMDHGEFDTCASLYTKDGVMHRGGAEFKGAAAIVGALSKRSPTQVGRHVISNTVFKFRDDNNADIISYYVAFNFDSKEPPKLPLPLHAPFSMGEWHDSLIRTPEGWRFTRRETKRLFQRPGEH